ncbi:unnamed protein product [Camellia sinensis]
MSQDSPRSPFEVPHEEEDESEELDTDTDNQQQFEEEEADGSESDSEDCSMHTSSPDPDIHQENRSRNVFVFKPRCLKMKDINSPPDLPAKIPFKNSVEEDNSQSRAQNGDHDEEKPRNDLNNDEITILKSILDYYSKNGAYPLHNSPALHDFLKNSLQIDVRPWDLNDEISILREKYINIREKESDMNADDDHLNEFNEDKKKKGLRVEEEPDLSEFPFLKESLHFGKNLTALRLVGNSKLKELDEKWRKLQVEELEFFLKRLDLIREQTKLILDAI